MQLLRIAIMLGCLQCLQYFKCLQCLQPEEHHSLLSLLKRIQLERHYDTLVVYGGAPCVFHAVLPQLELPLVPLVLLVEGSSHKDWSFSSRALLLSCGAKAEQEQNTRTQLKLQQARRLVYLEAQLEPHSLCEDYFGREQHNVAVLSAEFATTGEFYSCRCFQPQNHEQLQLQDTNPIYVEQFRNMKGARIRSVADQLAPRSILYRDAATGKIRMVGFVANLINTFVQRVNATLDLGADYELGKVAFYGDIEALIRNNQLDMATALGSTMLSENFDYLSYPYVVTSYCTMVPLPADMPYRQIYAVIVDALVLSLLLLFFLVFSLLLIYSRHLSWQDLSLSNLLLNDRCLRGLLGQSYPCPVQPSRHLKAICCLLCFASIMTTTMYNSYLQAYFTHPPSEPTLRSFKDIRSSSFKIAVHRLEANMLLKSRNLSTDDGHNLYVLEDYNQFIQLRNTFNSSYVYPVTELRWRTYDEQQGLFDVPVFYYSTDICLYRFVLLSVPLRRHLPYRQLFEQHLQFMLDFGMLQYWLSRSFYDMVIYKQTPVEDYSRPKPKEDALYLRDLTWILVFYGSGHLLACICFASELCRGRSRLGSRLQSQVA